MAAAVTAAAAASLAALLCASAAGAAGTGAFYAQSFDTAPAAATLASLGGALFFDPSLSASGRLACASCHDPQHAFGPADARPVQSGGADGRSPGLRAVPSLMYAQNLPPFSEHFVDDDGDDSLDQGPTGGRTWDGRAESAHEQARLPLFSPLEMANESPEALAARVRRSPQAPGLRAAFGDSVLGSPSRLLAAVLLALETFQQEPALFYPYTSKYDAWLRREDDLSAAEQRGLALFNDPLKGNCARCHPSAMKHGAFPQFTDFGYAAIGVPRNAAIPANADPRYFDLGLCGPLRTDLAGNAAYCGLFKTPSLRNVARREVFFHNGRFHDLKEVLRFYALRDARPQEWYPRTPQGTVRRFDDLPAAYQGNVDREAPFGAPRQGRLTEADLEDLLAFLNTLTDGYTPKRPPQPQH